MTFSDTLLKWYDEHRRNLPWRGLHDAYRVWVSEIILQQTRIDQGIGYYHRFVETFPDIYALATASEDEVLRVWQGLGYYSRARNMHETARNIVANHGGSFPQSSAKLIKLKGIGEYTAAALASIVFNENVPALDGNVYRVLARIFAVPHSIDTSPGKKTFRELAMQLMPDKRPGEFNQALMDFGSMVCKPVNPLCNDCIFQDQCLALQKQSVDKYPVRNIKRKVRERYFNYFLFQTNGPAGEPCFFIQKRTGNDIWKNMYELPLLETSSQLSEEEIFSNPWWKALFPAEKDVLIGKITPPMLHQLTHQRIHARLIHLKISSGDAKILRNRFRLTDNEGFNELPKPRLIEMLVMQADEMPTGTKISDCNIQT